jgi:hypothetical protein
MDNADLGSVLDQERKLLLVALETRGLVDPGAAYEVNRLGILVTQP